MRSDAFGLIDKLDNFRSFSFRVLSQPFDLGATAPDAANILPHLLMISRVLCARRVCLSCRSGIIQRTTARPRMLPIHHELGRRRFASAQDVSKDDILDALMSGRRSVGKKAGKRERVSSWDGDTQKPAKRASAGHKSQRMELDEDEPIGNTRNEKLSKSRGLSDEQFVSQEVPEQTTEPQEDYVLPIDETEQQGLIKERTITRAFSEEDFNHWAAEEKEPTSEALEHYQNTQKPYIVGKTRLSRQNVGVGALGQRFNALVMKNPDALGHNKGRIVTAGKDLPPSIPFDLEGFSPVEDADMEPDEEAFLNLNTLRPTDSSTLTRYAFEALRDEIAEGFNGNQLILYWRRHDDPELKPAEASAAYSWLRDLGTWAPVDEANIYPISREKKAKQYYAYRIMTSIWGLQVQEQVETPGRVVARLATLPFTLITSKSSVEVSIRPC